MFFNRPDFDLVSAAPSTFALTPEGEMHDALRADYTAMAGMIFGAAPPFEAVIETVASLETSLNGAGTAADAQGR
jgi:hypothetical protein